MEKLFVYSAVCEIGSRKGFLNRCDAFEQCNDGSSWIKNKCSNPSSGEPPKYFDMRTYTCLEIPLNDAVCYTGISYISLKINYFNINFYF